MTQFHTVLRSGMLTGLRRFLVHPRWKLTTMACVLNIVFHQTSRGSTKRRRGPRRLEYGSFLLALIATIVFSSASGMERPVARQAGDPSADPPEKSNRTASDIPTFEQWQAEQAKYGQQWIARISPPLEVGRRWEDVKAELEEKKLTLTVSGYGNAPTAEDANATVRNLRLSPVLQLNVHLSGRGVVTAYDTSTIHLFGAGRVEDLQADVAPELWPLFRLLASSVGSSMVPESSEFDPVALVRTVNSLHGFGEDRVRAGIREYMRLCRQDHQRASYYGLSGARLFYVIRLLFVRTDGQSNMPEIIQGVTGIPQPAEDDSDWPLWPLMVQNDLPFNVVADLGFIVSGYVTPIEKHLDDIDRNCRLRDKPLTPAENPLSAADRVLSSDRWKVLMSRIRPAAREYLSNQALQSVRRQALRAVAASYPVNLYRSMNRTVPGKDGKLPRQKTISVPIELSDDVWAKHLEAVRQLDLQWNATQFRFARP